MFFYLCRLIDKHCCLFVILNIDWCFYGQETMPKRHESSEIWKHFNKSISDVCKANCKYCTAEISRGGKNAQAKGFTTTNMWTHIRRSHPEKLTPQPQLGLALSTSTNSLNIEPAPKRQATLVEMLDCNKMYTTDDPRAMEITKYILEAICVDMEPLNLVNKPGFKRLIKKLSPKYNMVSRTHITENLLPKMYDQVKLKIKSVLNELTYITLTSDIWTSSASSHLNDFISFTAHGLDKSFNPKSYCLEVMPFQGENHSGVNIAENMKMAILNWEILQRVIAIVTDNARNMICAVNELRDNLMTGSQFVHICCNAHTLQLVLEHGLFERESVKEVITTCRKIVGHFSHSTVSMKCLKKEQEDLGIPDHVLIQDVPTRWDSTYQMLERLNEQRIAIQAVLPKINCQHDLSSQQWTKIQNIVNLLHYFEQATKSLSAADVTLADVIPIVNSIFKVLNQSCSNRDMTLSIRGLAQDLSIEMEARFGNLESDKNCFLATALDPRYKARIFRKVSCDTIKDSLCQEINASATSRTYVQGPTEPMANHTITNQPSTSKGTIWNICKSIITDKEFDEPLSNFASNDTIQEEIKNYLKTTNLEMDASVADYWQNKASEYPNLKRVALKYLSLKPATMPSERLFSTAGLIHSDERNRLKGKNLKMLCFLNKNLPVINYDYN